jgi:hypothetical protein
VEHTDRISTQTTKETIMSQHMYELARQLQAQGVKTTATFNPARLTKTLRNMVRKSIAQGNHNGGYSSKARAVRQLVFTLAGEMPIVYVSQHANYMLFTNPRPVTADTWSEMIGLLEADCTLQKMGFDDLPERYYKPDRAEFYRSIDQRHTQNVKYLREAHQRSQHLVVRTPKIRQQLADTFLKERTIEEIAVAERLARMLDEDREWDIPTTHNF